MVEFMSGAVKRLGVKRLAVQNTGAPLVFTAWTVFVWGNRIANIFDDEGAFDATQVFSLTLAVTMTLLAVGAGISIFIPNKLRRALPSLFYLTVGMWMIRLPLILLNPDHEIGFKIVHTALAAISISLGLLAVRKPRPVETHDIDHG